MDEPVEPRVGTDLRDPIDELMDEPRVEIDLRDEPKEPMDVFNEPLYPE